MEAQDPNLWREIDLTKDKKKPTPESYEEDISRLNKTMQEGVKFK